MKVYFFVICVISMMTEKIIAQQAIHAPGHKKEKKSSQMNDLPDFDDYLLLDTKSDTTANVNFGDFDNDGHLDILLVKGRHWPNVNRILLGNGQGGIRRAYDLGKDTDRSFSAGVADFNGDGFPDIAIGNDEPDRKLIYFNDGKGNFKIGAEFGRPEWQTRNITIADINNDGLPDIIVANSDDSLSYNYICLNTGNGHFNYIPFARYPATTITAADFNKDGFIDLVVPYREGGQSYVYLGSADMAFSDKRRIPFGPPVTVIRMAAVADFNGDNLPDIVTINQNKSVIIYFGQKNHTFSAGFTLATSKTFPYALAIADLNHDKKMDIIVGYEEAPSTVFFNDGTGRNFKPVSFGDSNGTVYGFAIGDFNEDGIPDIAAARSAAPSILYFGHLKSKISKQIKNIKGK